MGINCPWGKYGIHGTTIPESVGNASSHGCFRMLNDDCEEVYRIVSVGTPVMIVGGCYGPFGNGFREIGPGMYGWDVQVIEYKLTELGFYRGPCRGRYDDAGFQKALYRFQKANGLPESVWIGKTVLEKMGLVLMD